jgi:hypothetical protein
MNAKVHYSWLGVNSKKTYLILSLQNLPSAESKKSFNTTFIARLLGILIALLFSDTEKISMWITIINQLMEP